MGKDRSSEEKEHNLKFRIKYSVLNVKYMTIKYKASGTGLRNAARSSLDLGAEEGQREAGHFTSCSEEDNLFLLPQKILNLLDLCLARWFRDSWWRNQVHLLITPDWKEWKEMSSQVSPKVESAQYPTSDRCKILVFFENGVAYPQKRDVGVSTLCVNPYT